MLEEEIGLLDDRSVVLLVERKVGSLEDEAPVLLDELLVALLDDKLLALLDDEVDFSVPELGVDQCTGDNVRFWPEIVIVVGLVKLKSGMVWVPEMTTAVELFATMVETLVVEHPPFEQAEGQLRVLEVTCVVVERVLYVVT